MNKPPCSTRAPERRRSRELRPSILRKGLLFRALESGLYRAAPRGPRARPRGQRVFKLSRKPANYTEWHVQLGATSRVLRHDHDNHVALPASCEPARTSRARIATVTRSKKLHLPTSGPGPAAKQQTPDLDSGHEDSERRLGSRVGSFVGSVN